MQSKQGENYSETPVNIKENKQVKFTKPLALVTAAGACIIVFICVAVFSFSSEKSDKTLSEPQTVSSEEIIDNAFTYTPEEITEMREYGLSSEQIQQAQSEYKYAEDVIAEASEQIKLKQKEIMDRLSDPGSAEYRKMLNQTYLGEPFAEFPAVPDEKPKAAYSVKENVDYEKLPTHGRQLLVKLTRADGSHLFTALSPESWAVLPPSGNLVVVLTVETYGGVEYVTDISEFKIQ